MSEPAEERAAQGPAAGPATSYRERLRTPWWWYPAAAVVGVLLGAEFAFVIAAWLTWLPIVLSVLVAFLVVWRLSSATVTVRGTELTAGDRTLDLHRISQAIDLSASELRRVVGRHGDPLAYNFIRSWVGPGVQLILRGEPDLTETADAEVAAGPVEPDPDELTDLRGRRPEPYWLVSTRHPNQLIAAIQAAVDRSQGATTDVEPTL